MKVYVGNLPYEASEQELEQLFSQSGEVISVAIIKDRDTGRSKGFGFVEFQEKNSSDNAISEFDGHELHGRKIRVSEAREKPKGDRPPRRGGGGGGGGRW
ncbi:MAG: RNA-binding protein [Pseudobdellovibrionaceae bacterium]|nr:MAG: RNA-binding protein [Pseudobdellovibrionaceae bacterium]